VAQVLDARCLPIGYLQETEIGHRGVPIVGREDLGLWTSSMVMGFRDSVD